MQDFDAFINIFFILQKLDHVAFLDAMWKAT